MRNIALKDGKVDPKEAEMIEKAAQGAGIDDDGISKLHDALADGELDEEDKKLLEKLIEESA